MVEFIRNVLRGIFKLILFLVVSAFIAGFMAAAFTEMLPRASSFSTVFIVSWVVIALLIFAFPEVWK